MRTTTRIAALCAIALVLPSCGTIERALNHGPSRQPASQRSIGPMGASYDEFDVMRYGIMKRQMESMTGGGR